MDTEDVIAAVVFFLLVALSIVVKLADKQQTSRIILLGTGVLLAAYLLYRLHRKIKSGY